MIYEAFCRYFDLPITITQAELFPSNNQYDFSSGFSDEKQCLLEVYNIKSDSETLLAVNPDNIAIEFDLLRKNYMKATQGKLRRDYSACKQLSLFPESLSQLLIQSN